MNLDEARDIVDAMAYKPGWVLTLIERPGPGPAHREAALCIDRLDGEMHIKPLLAGLLPLLTPRQLAFWVWQALRDIELNEARAALRWVQADGRALTVDEIEGP